MIPRALGLGIGQDRSILGLPSGFGSWMEGPVMTQFPFGEIRPAGSNKTEERRVPRQISPGLANERGIRYCRQQMGVIHRGGAR